MSYCPSILYKANYLNANGSSRVSEETQEALAVAVAETLAANAVNEAAKNASIAIRESATKAATAAGGTAVAGTATAVAAKTAWIPVVGQIIAIVATIVGIGYMINGAEKAKAANLAVKNLGMVQIAVQQELDVIAWQTNATLTVLQNEIALREQEIRQNTILLYGAGTALFVSGLIFVYAVKKLKSK